MTRDAGAGGPEQGSSCTQDQAGTGAQQMETRFGAGNAGPTLFAGLSLCSARRGRRQSGWGCPHRCKAPGVAGTQLRGKEKTFWLWEDSPGPAVSDKPRPPMLASMGPGDGAVCEGWGTAPAAQPALTSLNSSSAGAPWGAGEAAKGKCLLFVGRQQVCCLGLGIRSVCWGAGSLLPSQQGKEGQEVCLGTDLSVEPVAVGQGVMVLN